MNKSIQPFKPRSIRSEGRLVSDEWTIKRYSIVEGAGECNWAEFEPGLSDILKELPIPAHTDQRPGVGFIIAHQAKSMDYLVLNWWDQENELTCRIRVREREAGEPWRRARDGESFCVWDLEVIWFEREAYVATFMQSQEDSPETEYLARTMPTKIIES